MSITSEQVHLLTQTERIKIASKIYTNLDRLVGSCIKYADSPAIIELKKEINAYVKEDIKDYTKASVAGTIKFPELQRVIKYSLPRISSKEPTVVLEHRLPEFFK
jgi:hypothetical protein